MDLVTCLWNALDIYIAFGSSNSKHPHFERALSDNEARENFGNLDHDVSQKIGQNLTMIERWAVAGAGKIDNLERAVGKEIV